MDKIVNGQEADEKKGEDKRAEEISHEEEPDRRIDAVERQESMRKPIDEEND